MTKKDQLSRGKKKTPRARKCLTCREWFNPKEEGVTTCSETCAVMYGKTNFTKQVQKEKRVAKRKLNEEKKQHWAEKAQKAFNAFIRKRDEKLPCISCQRYDLLKVNAGHYRPQGRNAQHRFNEKNVHKQCEACNTSLSGNLTEYRKHLITKIGLGEVEKIENDNSIKKFTIREYQEVEKKYKAKLSLLI